MSLIQQPFGIDHNDVLAAQELLAHPTMGTLVYKVLLIKEQQVLADIAAYSAMSDKQQGLDKNHQLTMFAGYLKAVQDFWPTLNAISQRDIAKEQATAAKKSARRSRRNQ